ncbi:hypothetical protein BS78_09G144900 [Paspalum vaginatum]|nr:hypothetical protein BS78_09G144900 [Paspalum vaginatum]
MATPGPADSSGPRFAPADPTLPEPWKGLIYGSILYYWNPETNVTRYEKPTSPSSWAAMPTNCVAPSEPTLGAAAPVATTSLSFPVYDGSGDPLGWLNCCEQYFQGQRTLESDKAWLALYHLTGHAQTWYWQMERDEHQVTWPQFKIMCQQRFGSPRRAFIKSFVPHGRRCSFKRRQHGVLAARSSASAALLLKAVAASAATFAAPSSPTPPPSSGAAITAALDPKSDVQEKVVTPRQTAAAVHLQAAACGFLVRRGVKQMLVVFHCGGVVAAPARPSSVVAVPLRKREVARHGAPLHRSVQHWLSSAATGQLPQRMPAKPPCVHWWLRDHEGLRRARSTCCRQRRRRPPRGRLRRLLCLCLRFRCGSSSRPPLRCATFPWDTG